MKVLKGFLAALCLLAFSGTANAVLREDSLDKTIVMLYSDLSAYQNNLEMHIAHYNTQRQEYRRENVYYFGELPGVCFDSLHSG
jgi:hypothetical protein